MRLVGYGPSVYCRMVRLVLLEYGRAFDWIEVDPLASPERTPHPMGQVPVLYHDGLMLFETGAITRYPDRISGGHLTPVDPVAAARMDQVIGIVDVHACRPLVRQVYAHAVFRSADGEEGDPGQVAEGLGRAGPVLDMLEAIVVEGRVLTGPRSLADCHLAPILAAFAEAPEARGCLASRPGLSAWLAGLDGWPAFAQGPGDLFPEPRA